MSDGLTLSQYFAGVLRVLWAEATASHWSLFGYSVPTLVYAVVVAILAFFGKKRIPRVVAISAVALLCFLLWTYASFLFALDLKTNSDAHITELRERISKLERVGRERDRLSSQVQELIRTRSETQEHVAQKKEAERIIGDLLNKGDAAEAFFTRSGGSLESIREINRWRTEAGRSLQRRPFKPTTWRYVSS